VHIEIHRSSLPLHRGGIHCRGSRSSEVFNVTSVSKWFLVIVRFISAFRMSGTTYLMIHRHILGKQNSWSHRCQFQNLKPHMCRIIIVRHRDPENGNCQRLKYQHKGVKTKLRARGLHHLLYESCDSYSSAPVSAGNTFHYLPQLCETADNTERCILHDIRVTHKYGKV
jgi:hypothetical protein